MTSIESIKEKILKKKSHFLGAYDLHNCKTEKLIGIDLNKLSWTRYIEQEESSLVYH
jgi:integrase/recombinase XerD